MTKHHLLRKVYFVYKLPISKKKSKKFIELRLGKFNPSRSNKISLDFAISDLPFTNKLRKMTNLEDFLKKYLFTRNILIRQFLAELLGSFILAYCGIGGNSFYIIKNDYNVIL